MSYNLKVLIVEDDPSDAQLLEHEMERAGIEFTARRVETKDAFQLALSEFAPDLILSDFTMPSFDGLSALGLARALAPETPFIFVSGTIGETRAIEALKLGATDYVLKDRPKRMISAIQHALNEAKENAERRDSQQALETSEKRLRAFMKHMPARAAMLDLEGRYEFVNEYWERTMGLTAEEVVGRGYEEVLSPNSAAGFAPYHRRVVETGAPVSRVFQTGAGDAARWWCSTYFPMTNANGELTLVGAVAIDITEQKIPKLRAVDSAGPGRAL